MARLRRVSIVTDKDVLMPPKMDKAYNRARTLLIRFTVTKSRKHNIYKIPMCSNTGFDQFNYTKYSRLYWKLDPFTVA